MTSADRKILLILLAVVALGFSVHFAGYVFSGRNISSADTRANTLLTQESIGPFYDAILHFFGDPDLK